MQTRIRQKDGTENFGGFVDLLDGFLPRDFVLWVFMCSINFSVSFFRLPRQGLPRPIYTPRAITPRAITPLPPLPGYHAEGYHARADTFNLTRYRVCRVTTPSYHATYKLLSTGGLSHLRVSFSYFSSHRLTRPYLHNHITTFQPSLAHTARTHSTNAVTKAS